MLDWIHLEEKQPIVFWMCNREEVHFFHTQALENNPRGKPWLRGAHRIGLVFDKLSTGDATVTAIRP